MMYTPRCRLPTRSISLATPWHAAQQQPAAACTCLEVDSVHRTINVNFAGVHGAVEDAICVAQRAEGCHPIGHGHPCSAACELHVVCMRLEQLKAPSQPTPHTWLFYSLHMKSALRLLFCTADGVCHAPARVTLILMTMPTVMPML